ncbi:MAG: protoporphyrinogen oxidase HemJ [Gammaproteobacteria bacterium]|nr:protoporphyrinogen oxidase HemJ [Gammaproteobacteria bacterium]
MLWLKALHLVFMVIWFAGLFYLPRLFVYHAMSDDQISIDRFKVMERKLFFGITTPGGVLTLLFGLGMLSLNGWSAYADSMWLHIKLILILLLVIYHIYCGKLLFDFKHDRNQHSHVWYRWFNEIPVIFLIAIMILAVVRPI